MCRTRSTHRPRQPTERTTREFGRLGAFAVGHVVYHDGAFYTCDVARSSSNTNNPATDTASWTIKLAETGGLSQAVQDAIDSQAKISFGENYKGKWEAGSYAVGDVVSHSGSFFECDTARSCREHEQPRHRYGELVGQGIHRGRRPSGRSTTLIDALGSRHVRRRLYGRVGSRGYTLLGTW